MDSHFGIINPRSMRRKLLLLLLWSLEAQQEQIATETWRMLSAPAHAPEVERLNANAWSDIFREPHNRRPFGGAGATYD